MTKLLLHLTLSRTAAKKLSFPDLTKKASQYALILWMVFLATPICGQHVDTWFTADRAVNISPTPVGQFHLFTPLPPADGTSVTTWYDFIDGSSQDAIQHPTPLLYPLAYPDGFGHFQTDGVTPFGSPAFLDPVGPIPGVPILRRNDMNFNPSIEFDGSGVGNALHFRSESREEITVFIVFKARGMGNTAESQRLLFGGDIDTHHSSTTNLSIGISDGNRFSIGRTWTTWSDFESGGIDLQGLPTIGVLIRQVDTDIILEDEVLNTQVNGLPDISIIKNHPGIERDLYLFNKLGKHFNSNDSNRNLTGNIAEILLADGPLDTNSIQRVESYLAIKYGITLNNIGGQLGSMVGNQGYTYLAADGTPIWLPDPIYLYDIAGLGRDRYDDFESGLPNDIGDLKLRYNLHQRIAKSENIEAIVTMSTNSDFINDNLDTSRPIIDNTTANSVSTTTTSVLHNYLLWGNNHGDINQTAIELPTNYSTRMGREWKIQKTVSPGGVDPINGVSVRIDLSSSNILNNGNCGDLVLIIDTDGDGNFLTGTQTEIAATSVDGSQNAYFNNIDFEHQDVFTIAFRDNTPPTASNPSTITVCDSTPIPDPSVVTDEADNCAVDTVTHIGDISDGLINPETITRIYRVTDIYNNYLDVQQTIYVYITPNINDIPDQEVCESYTLPQITGTDLSGNEAYYDLPGGPLGGGNIYSEGNIITTDMTLYIYDERGGVSRVCYDEESFNVTINNTPLADAPADVESCDSYTLPALANGNYFDAPGGGGNALSAGDDITTTTTLYVFSPGTGSCPDVENSFNVTINNTPLADAPADVESCDSYTLPALANGNYFDAPGGGGNALSAGDDITTTTTLYVFSPGTGSCPDVENSFNVTINNTPLADAPADVESCDSYTLPALANGNYFDAPGGGGNALSAGDDITTTTTLYVFSPGTGSCPDVENSFNVTINNTPLADAPADVESCDSYTLPALANGNYFDAPGGGGNALSAGDDITTTTTLYVFSPGTGSCPDVENSFEVDITGFEISTNVENETCWQSQDGIVHVNVFNTNLPLTVQLDSMPSTIFNQNAFSFDNLATGNHTLTVIDQNGCQSEANFEILAGGPNLDASIEPIYLCDSGLSSNTIAVTLSDPSIGNAVLYALDSTSPNDFIMTPNFENIAPGNHSLSILHTNGCLQEIPFNIGQVEPVSLSLANINVNEITATAMGGFPPYTYYFEDNPGTPSNTFSIDRSGTFIVRVMDRNGCETSETITLNLIEISIPNFFTPNNDGQNDYWRPRNMEWFPNVQTYIFDRYGRKIKIIGAFDYGWDGQYESKPMPSGDYWYIVKLNDGSGREFVGHFTLYR
ncbi:T9SS type B sorting domain-containing protein [Flagellimonas alvinocaridis]|uniref:T9SS type B sorting domain-containing protein n=1 Tax=Flagellimonas alvinocaridis TaxID=2530200 RepID=UPI003C7B2421